jgi:hypothetical protein
MALLEEPLKKLEAESSGFALDDAKIGSSPERYIAESTTAVVVGGTTAEISGGKFENGATTAAFQYMFNSVLTDSIRRWGLNMGPVMTPQQQQQVAAGKAKAQAAAPVEFADKTARTVVYAGALTVEKAAVVGEGVLVAHFGVTMVIGGGLYAADKFQERWNFDLGTAGEGMSQLGVTPYPAFNSAVQGSGLILQGAGALSGYGEGIMNQSCNELNASLNRSAGYIRGDFSREFYPFNK